MLISKFCKLTIILLNLFNLASSNDSNLKAKLSFNVTGDGFHRKINYEINLTNFTSANCHIALHLNLPSAIYVNVDELSNLQRFQNFTVCSSGETNVELFAEEANTQQVTICSPINGETNHFSLPLHERYLKAKDSEYYVNVTLPAPKILLGCPERIKHFRVSGIDLCKPCVDYSTKWREIPHRMESDEYIWRIPIGNLSHQYYVTIITLVTSVLGAFVILISLYR